MRSCELDRQPSQASSWQPIDGAWPLGCAQVNICRIHHELIDAELPQQGNGAKESEKSRTASCVSENGDPAGLVAKHGFDDKAASLAASEEAGHHAGVHQLSKQALWKGRRHNVTF